MNRQLSNQPQETVSSPFQHSFDLQQSGLSDSWPKKGSSEVDCDDTDSLCSSNMSLNQPKRVVFSEYSEICVYQRNDKYEYNKSYSSADRKTFRCQALLDGDLIREVIASCPLQDANALHRLLEMKVLRTEDLLGIEHLISEKGNARALKQRRTHVALLLRRQEKLRRENIADEVMLAESVLPISAKSAAKARCRAALAV
jgi:hypothetical protein